MRLVPASPAHAEIWHQWRHEPKCLAFNPIMDLDLDQVQARLGELSSDLSDHDAKEYRWFAERNGELVATVALDDVDRRNGYGEIGYQTGAAFEGQGWGGEAVGLLIHKVFSETPLRKLTATIAVDNVASRRLVERLGFVQEGLLREHFSIQGRFVDQAMYGLLRSDLT